MKFRQVKVEFFHADQQTDGRIGKRDEANSRFSQFSKAPKRQIIDS